VKMFVVVVHRGCGCKLWALPQEEMSQALKFDANATARSCNGVIRVVSEERAKQTPWIHSCRHGNAPKAANELANAGNKAVVRSAKWGASDLYASLDSMTLHIAKKKNQAGAASLCGRRFTPRERADGKDQRGLCKRCVEIAKRIAATVSEKLAVIQ
jgi:hypothetical protein